MADDAAAALSQLPPPSRWEHFELYPHQDGTWTMTVQLKGNAYDRTITLPDYTAAKAVIDLASIGPTQGMGVADPSAWDRFIDEERDFDVADTI